MGLTGDFGLMWLLPRAVGPSRAMELLMTAEIIDAVRAEQLGIVMLIVAAEDLASEALALAEQLAKGPPLAQAMTKRGLHRSLEAGFLSMLEWESMAQTILGRTEDAREGVMAFLERRAPAFSGK